MTIIPVGIHRGFEIGYAPHPIHGWPNACWRLPGQPWRVGRIVCDDAADAEWRARECVDYQYRIDVVEFLTGEPHDPMVFIQKFEEPA